jgi:BirA family biotin operon repressor/biotin-[acetyl-CoA-carboxylase] ligase
LTFSLILDARAAELPEGRRTLVSLAAGLAACRALAARLPDRAFGLKWPNDVYLESRKVCGILVEVPAKRPGVMVLGVGINVNNTLAEAPDELRGKATSLFDATGIRHDLTDVLIDVLERLAGELEILSRDPDSLARRWNEHCLLHARTVCLEVGSRQVEGRCRGIDGSGAIILETGAGIELFHSGVVTGFE